MGDRMDSDGPLELCNAAAKVTFMDGTSAVLILNQFSLDEAPKQMESLLNPHQTCAHKVLFD